MLKEEFGAAVGIEFCSYHIVLKYYFIVRIRVIPPIIPPNSFGMRGLRFFYGVQCKNYDFSLP